LPLSGTVRRSSIPPFFRTQMIGSILTSISSYLGLFLYLFYGSLWLGLTCFESKYPRRVPRLSRWLRWRRILGLFLIDQILLQIVSSAITFDLSYVVWKNGWGLLNYFHLASWLSLTLSWFFLDLQVYALHVLYHKVPWGWRFHRVHHLDLDMDAITGLYFHPFESLISFIVSQAMILMIGPSPLVVFLFNSFFMAALFLTHANIRIPGSLDRFLRCFIVTPDMHRIHHSKEWEESNSNYGFWISWWDHLFGTYRKTPLIPAEKMELGLKEYPLVENQAFFRLLGFPFLPRKGDSKREKAGPVP